MERPHHFMVLMRQDVAVPYVPAGFVEGHLDASHFAGRRQDHVAPGSFGWVRFRFVAKLDDLFEPVTKTF